MKRTEHECKRCGYIWTPKAPTKPKVCPRCKSYNWQTPSERKISLQNPVVYERSLERYLVKLCNDQGWLCEKFTSPGKRGVPDRIIIAGPCCNVVFVELKSPKGRLTPLQRQDHQRRARRGCNVVVIRSKYEARELVAKIRKRTAQKPA